MAEYAYNPVQTVEPNQNIILDTVIHCNKGYVYHRNQSGIVILRGIVNNPTSCFARYQVTFNGNWHGYEIHQGDTVPFGDAESKPLAVFDDGRTDGYVASEKCMGTYIHGILDNPAFVERLLKPFADKINADAGVFDYHEFKERQYNLLADHVRKYVDIPHLYQILMTND